MLRLMFFVVPLVLAIYCLVEAISSRDDEVRHLSRVWWILLILFFPFVGSIAWLAAGRPVRAPRRTGAYERPMPEFPEYDRPGRLAASDPEADAEFLRKVRARAEEQRRKAQEQRRAAEAGGTPSEAEGDSGSEDDAAPA